MTSEGLEAHITDLLGTGDLVGAATLIVEGYGPGIMGYLAAVVRDTDAAREVFSEFTEELWKGLPRFSKRSKVKTWAYAIGYHCALRFRRARARRKTRPLRDSELSKIAEAARTVSRLVTSPDVKLDKLREALSPDEHTLLVLRVDRGMSWEDIASVMGRQSPAALRKRFQRLKDRLRALAASG